MIPRLLTAAVGIPLLLLVILAGVPWLFTLVVAAVAVAGAREFARLLSGAGLRPQTWVMLPWVGALVVSSQLDGSTTLAVMTAGVLLSLTLLLFRNLRSRHSERSEESHPQKILASWGATVAGALYLGWTLSHGPLLFSLDQGPKWVLLWLFTTFATDTGAFLVGSVVGRHALAPAISPGKTWEGAVGGWLAGVGAAVALGALLSLQVPWWLPLLLGALVGVFGQIGDLVESLFKRGAQVKEAGRLLPGHGGLLDRLDSVVFTLPVVYYGIIVLNGG